MLINILVSIFTVNVFYLLIIILFRPRPIRLHSLGFLIRRLLNIIEYTNFLDWCFFVDLVLTSQTVMLLSYSLFGLIERLKFSLRLFTVKLYFFAFIQEIDINRIIIKLVEHFSTRIDIENLINILFTDCSRYHVNYHLRWHIISNNFSFLSLRNWFFSYISDQVVERVLLIIDWLSLHRVSWNCLEVLTLFINAIVFVIWLAER